MVQPRNPAEPPRDGLHDATQVCEQVPAAPVQPLRQNAGTVRTVTATSASLPQGELCEHEALETWINAHGACPHATAASARVDDGRRTLTAAKLMSSDNAGDITSSRHNSSNASVRRGSSLRTITPDGTASGAVVRTTASFLATGACRAGPCAPGTRCAATPSSASKSETVRST